MWKMLFWGILLVTIFSLCLNDTSFLCLIWREQVRDVLLPVIKHMDKEPLLSLHMCPGRARTLRGDLQQWPPPCIYTEPQSPPRFLNGHQIHLRTWASVCPLSIQVKVLSPLMLTHLGFSVFPLTCNLAVTQGRIMEGFCVSNWELPGVQGPQLISFISCTFLHCIRKALREGF